VHPAVAGVYLTIDNNGFASQFSRCASSIITTTTTTNRPFEEWANVFGDAVLASAIVDRIVHHSHIIKILGKNYRMKGLTTSENRIMRDTV